MPKPPRGEQACVDITLDSSPATPPIGVVIIVIVYWAIELPQLSEWRSVLESLLHAAVAAVSLQLVFQVVVAARGSLRRVGRALRGVGTWVRRRVRLRVEGGLVLRMGES
ncbi:hypothetical protein Adi01nite_33730 [Amorphoplanes digitatis]|nr:hypothetical protein Adi01nite_33730 [Actinoplanes digitatis]